ncbi:unnamed protein product [Meloidogyne enterolobii]|uniref:Uncharacterized protein n=1 Tax=Meloidogyne enterolobii TaxID=390850 RepID=A0ACB1AFD4_MELEN
MGNPSTPVNSPSPVQNGTVKRAKRKASGGLPIGANGQIQADCLICSDRATGKHYGSVSCDGCKGFFRRTIRKKHIYVCRFNSNCVVDKNQRNSCRRCRFEKCLINGMRPEAVQLERDRIAATRRSNCDNMKILVNTENGDDKNLLNNSLNIQTPISSPTSTTNNEELKLKNAAIAENKAIIFRLINAEKILSSNNKKEENDVNEKEMKLELKNNCKIATTGDVTDSMHHQLILLVEWAKQLEEFRRLSLFSQIALLRHFSAQHLVICAAYRSSKHISSCESNDAIWLANDRCVPRDAPKLPDVNCCLFMILFLISINSDIVFPNLILIIFVINTIFILILVIFFDILICFNFSGRVVARILDHLTAPMRRLHLEDREFVALKAVAFFDPMAKDIEEPAKLEIEKIRQQIMLAFEYQVTNKVNNQQLISLNNRLANLLLLLPPLMAIGRDLVEEAQLAKLFGLANVDELMAELLLPEDAETRSYSRLRTSVTSSIVQSNVTSPNPPATSPQILQIPGIVTAATSNNSQSLLSIPTYSSTSSLMLQIGCCSTLPLQQQQNSFGNLQNREK